MSEHDRYAAYVEWCKSMKLPPADFALWRKTQNRIADQVLAWSGASCK